MPKSYPEWPSGDQVRSYVRTAMTPFSIRFLLLFSCTNFRFFSFLSELSPSLSLSQLEAYAEKNNLLDVIALNTKVTNLYDESEGSSSEQFANWKIETSFNSGPAQLEDQVYDHVVICNGIFSEGAVPNYPGREAFEAAGGKLSHTSSAGALGNLKGKDVVVVGYGKSACDLANAVASSQAASTTLVARRIIWKLPRKLGGVLSYKFLLLTRFGEALFEYVRPSSFIERFFHSGGVGTKIRNSLIVSLEFVVRKQLGLKSLNLLPEGSFDEIARSTISLSTEGFYDKVQRKEIQVRKDSRIEELTTVEVSENGKSKVRPAVRLGTETSLMLMLLLRELAFIKSHLRFWIPRSMRSWLTKMETGCCIIIFFQTSEA